MSGGAADQVGEPSTFDLGVKVDEEEEGAQTVGEEELGEPVPEEPEPRATGWAENVADFRKMEGYKDVKCLTSHLDKAICDVCKKKEMGKVSINQT